MKAKVFQEITGLTIAIASIAAAILLRSLLDPILDGQLALITTYGAVAITVWFAGLRYAVFTTLVGYALVNYLFMEPRGTFHFGDPASVVGFALYLVSCSLIIFFGERANRAERRRHEADEQLQLALGAGQIGTWDWDLRTGKIHASPEARRMLGTSHFGSLEEGLASVHPEDRPAIEAALERAIVDGKPFAAEARYTRPDGVVLRLSGHGVVRVDRHGRPVRIVAATIDQTEAWRAAESLRHERELLRRIIDTIPVMITVFDPEATMLRLNPEFTRVVGWSTEEAKGASLMEEIYPDPAYRRQVLEFMESCREGWMDVRMRTRDGRTIETSWASIRLSDDTRVGIGIDITERKRAERALRTRNRRLRLLFEAAAVTLTSDDPDAMLHALFAKIRPELALDGYWNYVLDESGTTLLLASYEGAPPDVMREADRLPLGQGVNGKVAVTRHPIVRTRVQESSDGEDGVARRLGLRAFICHPLAAGDRLIGTLTLASRSRDTFEPDELEFAETICQHVTLAYERIRHVRELKESGRMKDEFLATRAHELRNPLAPIRTAAPILKQHGPREPELVWARQVIERQAEHLSRLVDDLLDVSRITRGKIELRRERIPATVIVSSAVETARPLIEGNQHALTVSLPGEPLFVNGDLTRMAQVVSNLLTNAAKYTPPGGRIEVGAERDGDQAVLRVKDNGVGIPREMLGRIFEMFAQVDSSLERTAGGLGIGLTLARTLVELHGGSIEAQSDGAGRGSEFLVRLPLATADPPPLPPPASAEGPGGREARARIMVVDDNADAADSLGRLLALDGYDVRVANGGMEALHDAEAFRPEVILLDIGLPMMNGYDVARRLRKEPWGAEIRLVALTGWGQDEDRRRSKEAGFDEHVVKPIDPASLRVLLRRVRATRVGSP
ncbi:MAG TPA: ATP-binding protein [Candidatus Omnitrophota bacterium]|nr:ATP-binding protein [Candidatus Omnitrophota bacterium]